MMTQETVGTLDNHLHDVCSQFNGTSKKAVATHTETTSRDGARAILAAIVAILRIDLACGLLRDGGNQRHRISGIYERVHCSWKEGYW
jgi:hypothetical protein